ncbi:MAG: hypothetical protein LBT05_05470 [Planctomycetaceae bacterium]|jgi:predicted metallopeptidase|nr:hypothetical protein [Planctomycetaceae bacterium]
MSKNPKLKRVHRVVKAATGFNFTTAMRTVCEDICMRVSELSHINMDRVAISFSQTRHSQNYGVFASLTPLRFLDGRASMQHKGKYWAIQRYRSLDGFEYYYILYFYLPRFLNMKLTDKLETIIHELYHINPTFNGDIRRFEGRCYAHGNSQKEYDAVVHRLMKKWFDQNPSPEIWEFLRFNHDELTEHFGAVYGTKIPPPKILPVVEKSTKKTKINPKETIVW